MTAPRVHNTKKAYEKRNATVAAMNTTYYVWRCGWRRRRV